MALRPVLGVRWCFGLLAVTGAVVLHPAHATAATIDFDSLSDFEAVTTQFPGVTLTGATVLTAGISLNEFDFPPASGTNVAFDDGGPVSLVFETLVTSFFGRFTYVLPVALYGYNASDLLVATAFSSFFENYVTSGNPPNELVGFVWAGGLSRVVIEGDPFGGSFVMDDLAFTERATPVPEPGTLALVALGGLALGQRVRSRQPSGPRRLGRHRGFADTVPAQPRAATPRASAHPPTFRENLNA